MAPASTKSGSIESYLLGELPEGEMSELEERIFADDKFFEDVRIAEMHLIDRFVDKEMDGAELLKFRAAYLDDPERSKQVKAAQDLQNELRRMNLALAPNGNSADADRGLLSTIFGRLLPLVAGAAAAVVIAIGLWLFYLSSAGLGDLAVIPDRQDKDRTIASQPVAPGDLSNGESGNIATPVRTANRQERTEQNIVVASLAGRPSDTRETVSSPVEEDVPTIMLRRSTKRIDLEMTAAGVKSGEKFDVNVFERNGSSHVKKTGILSISRGGKTVIPATLNSDAAGDGEYVFSARQTPSGKNFVAHFTIIKEK